jgi:hypothetical protein
MSYPKEKRVKKGCRKERRIKTPAILFNWLGTGLLNELLQGF